MCKTISAARRFCLLFALFAAMTALLYSTVCGTTVFAAGGKSAYISMERDTGTVFGEVNADLRLPMASTTKIMTALIICEDCDPDEVVTVPDEVVGAEGSSIYLKKGEIIDVRDLLYGMMLRSGNDAAAALAILHSGSIAAFADRMNLRAKELGAENTHFVNPSGLPDDSHYTTARDLCKIACAAMKNNLFRTVVGTKSWSGKFRSYTNKNKTLYNYGGATGIKTGYTIKAGRCLVSSACRDGMEVVCVVLNEPDMYGRSFAAFDDIFARYELKEIAEDKVFMCDRVLCKLANSCKFVVEKGKKIEYVCVPATDENAGGVCGKLQIYAENSLIFSANLYSIV